MSLFKKRVFPYLLVTPLVLALSSCFDSENSSKTNPDFNHNILFTDYGTYGRTIYFTDNDGQEWCYYDLLKVDSASQLEFIISEPIQNRCSIDNSRHFSIFETMITGENKKYDSIIISTSSIYTRKGIYPSNGDYSESNIEYQEMVSNKSNYIDMIINDAREVFPSAFNSTIVSFLLTESGDTYVANIISPSEYIYFGAPLPSDNSGASFFFFFSFDSPRPPLDVPYTFAVNREDREALYTAHPYQRLTPTDDDPYPLIQIHIE